jgi:hypothetical protein
MAQLRRSSKKNPEPGQVNLTPRGKRENGQESFLKHKKNGTPVKSKQPPWQSATKEIHIMITD